MRERDIMSTQTRTSVNMALIAALVAVATIGGLLFGYDSGAVNGTQDGLRTTFNLTDASLGFTVGSLPSGCAVGAFFAGMLADAMGRRKVMVVAAVLFLIGALVQGFTGSHTVFVIARFSAGLTAAFVGNYFLAGVAGSSLGELGGREAWRWMFLAQAVPAAVFLVALLFIPESPRYLVSRNAESEAQSVLTNLIGPDEATRKVGEIKASFH